MDMEKEVYHSNGMLGLVSCVEESESMSFHFGKILTSDSKDFFNCDTTIGLEYPVRSALQPICVHVEDSESTNWVNPPCDENVDLLDISSKRLPVDLGLNGLDKSSIHSSSSNGTYCSNNFTPNNHVIANSLPPASELTPPDSDYYGNNSQYHELYSVRNDYSNHTSFVDSEKLYYNGNQSLFSNGYHSQPYDHTNHHVNYDHLNHHHLHNFNHSASHQMYHNHHSQPTTPLQHFQPQKKGQQPFQRHNTHRRRLNLYEKSSPSPTKHKQKQQQPQSPLQTTKSPKTSKPPKPPKPQKSPLTQRPQKPPKHRQKPHAEPQSPPEPEPKPNCNSQSTFKRKKRVHVKTLETKSELNQRVTLKKKLGRPRKYDYSPPKPTKFRSPRLRLRVQSEGANSDEEPDSGDKPGRSRRSENTRKVQEKKIKEVLPCDWIRPDNLTFDRKEVSDYEKTSLPEFFAGKFDRTHFHPSQYLQIRNIFLDEWESRKPNSVGFREMIRMHKGIGNVVSFSRVCKFLTAIGAINEISEEEDEDENEEDSKESNKKTNDVTDDTCTKEDDDNSSSQDESQSKVKDEESEDPKDSNQTSSLSSTSSSSPLRETNVTTTCSTISPPPTPTSSQPEETPTETSRPRRKGRKRKSYFLNEMTRLGIDPLSAGFPMPGFDKEDKEDKDDKDEGSEQTK